MIVPTLRVGMPPRTLRVRLWKGRGASRAAFPRRAWERSVARFQPFLRPLAPFFVGYAETNGHSASARYRPLWDSNKVKRSARRKNSGGVADSGTGAR